MIIIINKKYCSRNVDGGTCLFSRFDMCYSSISDKLRLYSLGVSPVSALNTLLK
jgi:hypothetical protein